MSEDKQTQEPAEEPRYLNPDGTAASPLAAYPGTVSFPLIMTLPMHKRGQRYVNSNTDRDEDDPRVGVAFNAGTDDDSEQRIVFIYDDVELALMFGKLDMTGPDGKRFNPKTPDDLPLPLAVWLARCYREWENSQVRFRWDGIIGLASSNGS